MIDLSNWDAKRRTERTERSPLYRTGLLQLQSALSAESGGISGQQFLEAAGAAAKEAMIDIIVEDLTVVAVAGNRFLANRQKLASHVYRMARYGVLIPADLMPVSADDRPGVSGELNANLDALIELDPRLNRLSSIDDVAVSGDLTSVCHFGYWSARLGASVFNSLRQDLNDIPHDPAHGWFASLVLASGALEEARYRRALEVEQAGHEQPQAEGSGWTVELDDGGWIDLHACALFVEQVSDGTAKPLTRWLHLPEPEIKEPMLAEIDADDETASDA